MSTSWDNVTIRTELKPGDVGYLTYMHATLYDFMPEFELYVAETLSDFVKNLDQSCERIWIAEKEDQIVGSIALKKTNDFAQLRYFLLAPECRGMGLGKHMMSLFMDFMQECGYKKSFLLTESNLHTAAALYAQYGYQFKSSTVTDYGLEERRYELIME